MKFVSYLNKNEERVGIYYQDKVFDLQKSASSLKVKLPSTMKKFLDGEIPNMKLAKKIFDEIKKGKIKSGTKYSSLKLLAPVPDPTSLRDGYAFRQHVATARRNRGVDMIPEFDQYPIFYFGNHNTCLLYTSPSPRDRTRSRMPSSA